MVRQIQRQGGVLLDQPQGLAALPLQPPLACVAIQSAPGWTPGNSIDSR